MVTERRPEQPLNADSPMLVTDSGIWIEVKPLQKLKAFTPMEVIESGMEKEVRPVQKVVSIISWLSVLYALNGRKVAMWILFRYEKVIFNVFNF